jgi:hypothetical protein
LRAIEKNGLAANNGDTLGEAVISVKTKNSDQDSKEKIRLKTTTKKSYYIIISYLFQ